MGKIALKQKLKILFNHCFIFILIIPILIGTIFNVKISLKNAVNNSKFTFASNDFNAFSETSQDVQYSIFINNPTYSFKYNSNIYFIDQYDNNLKIFNINDSEFYSKYLNLSKFGKILDCNCIDGYIFAITQIENHNYILKINLDLSNLTANLILNDSTTYILEKNFTKISASKIKDNIYLTLTPETQNNNLSPKILKINLVSNSISNELNIEFDETLKSKINPTLFKIILDTSSNSTDYLHLIFARSSGLISANIPTSSIENDSTIMLFDTNFERNLDSTNFDSQKYKSVNLKGINLTYQNDEKFLFVTYDAVQIDDSICSYTKIYKLNISLFGSGSIFTNIFQFDNPVTDHLTVSENYILYPSNQNINFVELTGFDSEITSTAHTISNPNLIVKYYEENDFVFAKTTKETALLSNPWNSTGIIQISDNSDIIIIGNGYIENQKLELEDFKYCLYTFGNKNYLGYINIENYTKKEIVSIDSLDANICKVITGTALYNLPTKVLGDNITSTLKSSIITTISDNSRIEIIDLICDYKSNNSIFVKVKVNNDKIGYIETNQIQKKLDINKYITCNATIKLDGANLYESATTESSVILTLNSGTRIKVTGSRDKVTGMTEITFQDEYGNLFSGFVVSDYISNDGWTTMQIIGAILIAVNIGILILIIYFINKKRVQSNKNKSNELELPSLNQDFSSDENFNNFSKFD